MTRMNDVRQRTLSEQEGIVLDEERVEHVRQRLETLFHDRDLAAVETERQRDKETHSENRGWGLREGERGRDRENKQAVGKAGHRAPALD